MWMWRRQSNLRTATVGNDSDPQHDIACTNHAADAIAGAGGAVVGTGAAAQYGAAGAGDP